MELLKPPANLLKLGADAQQRGHRGLGFRQAAAGYPAGGGSDRATRLRAWDIAVAYTSARVAAAVACPRWSPAAGVPRTSHRSVGAKGTNQDSGTDHALVRM